MKINFEKKFQFVLKHLILFVFLIFKVNILYGQINNQFIIKEYYGIKYITTEKDSLQEIRKTSSDSNRFPNPFAPTTYLSLYINEGLKSNLTIIDSNNRIVGHYYFGHLKNGAYIIRWPYFINDLPAGRYSLILEKGILARIVYKINNAK